MLLAFGLKPVSSVPSAFTRAIKLRVTPPTVVNEPPSKIFPSDCTAIDETVLFVFGLKPVSSVPSAFRRAMPMRVTPPTVVNCPPSKIFPSDCTATA